LSLRTLPAAFYRRPAEVVARDLLGRWLVRDLDGERLVLRLVEVEAYLGAGDAAAHTYGGRRTRRVESMYRGGGHAYVYFTYGMHFCLNVVCGEPGSGTAVLLRAGEAVGGAETMRRLRGPAAARGGAAVLAGGPGRLCQALAIDRALDGHLLWRKPLRLAAGAPVGDAEAVVGPRVGVAYAGEAARWPLRFALRASPAVSRPRPVG
jgi:DNA-3-methyladenine glycosylase